MRESALSIGDDYWIEDESGRRAFKVDGKAVRVRDTFVLRDASGQEAAKIQERKVRVRDTMEIERDAGSATVRKALVGLRDRFKIDVAGALDLSAHGNLVRPRVRDRARGRHGRDGTCPLASWAARVTARRADPDRVRPDDRQGRMPSVGRGSCRATQRIPQRSSLPPPYCANAKLRADKITFVGNRGMITLARIEAIPLAPDVRADAL